MSIVIARSLPASTQRAQPVDAAVPDHAHVAAGQAELARDAVRRRIVPEGHHEHRALALGQPLQAVGHALVVEARRDVDVRHRQRIGMALQQIAAPALAAQQVAHRQPARAEHEREHALGLAQPAVAQLLDRERHHMLHQVGRRVGIAQMAQAVAARARREQAVQLGLGGGGAAGTGGGDARARSRPPGLPRPRRGLRRAPASRKHSDSGAEKKL